MNAIKNFDDALDFFPRSEDQPGHLSHLLKQVSIYWTGVRDGLDAAHTYAALSARGVPHDIAVRETFARHLDN